MNRLKHLSCYLSGSIDFADDMGHGWRDNITPWLEERNVRVFNPLKPIFEGSKEFDIRRPEIKKMQEEGRFEELRLEIKNVNRWDLRAIDLSSFVICDLDINIHLCGSYEEIFVANQQSKPVLFHTHGKKNKLSKWLYGRFPHQHMFNTWDELKHYLDSINSDPNFEFTDCEKKRWMLFAGNHLYDKLEDMEFEQSQDYNILSGEHLE